MNGVKVALILLVLCVIYAVFCLVRRWLFIRSHKVCPNCSHQMNVLWIDEEHVHIGGMHVIAGKVTRYTSLLRCSHCGYEIPLWKDQ